MLSLHRTRRRLAAGLVLLALGFGPAGVARAASGEAMKGDVREMSARVARLIQRLGDDDYAVRKKAQSELLRMSLVAFDALLEAQEHEDVEIAMRAAYLIRSMRIDFVRQDDPPEVRAALRGYEKLPRNERLARLRSLASLSDRLGTDALCRVVRFEADELLSKEAALLVMGQEPPEAEASRKKLSAKIAMAAGLSRRTAAAWLRTYAHSLVDPASAVDDWDRLVRAEQDRQSVTPEKSSLDILRDMLSWQADLLRRLGREDDAFRVILRRLRLVKDRREEVISMLGRLMDQKAWSLVDELQRQFQTELGQDAEFLYLLAEARLKQGKKAEGDALADQAWKLAPKNGPDRATIGFRLQSRGLFDWAEREYRYATEHAQPGTPEHVAAHLYLSEMYHDQLQEQQAAKVLERLMDLAGKDPNVLREIRQRRSNEGRVGSRRDFFWSRHYHGQGDYRKEREYLEKAIAQDPTDVDVLIGMYRLPDQDEAWRNRTRELIHKAGARSHDQLTSLEQQIERIPDPGLREQANRVLATLNNQYAWLVSNTEGDFDEAIRCSRRSLQLAPDTAGFLDTLGRCYYAKGDLENAVKYQSQAAKGDPHAGAVGRQLALFQKALADSKKKTPE